MSSSQTGRVQRVKDYLFGSGLDHPWRGLFSLLVGCALIVYNLVWEQGEGPLYPPYFYVNLVVGAGLILGAVGDLLPANWRVMVGLLRVGGWTLITLAVAGAIIVVLAIGTLTSW